MQHREATGGAAARCGLPTGGEAGASPMMATGLGRRAGNARQPPRLSGKARRHRPLDGGGAAHQWEPRVSACDLTWDLLPSSARSGCAVGPNAAQALVACLSHASQQ